MHPEPNRWPSLVGSRQPRSPAIKDLLGAILLIMLAAASLRSFQINQVPLLISMVEDPLRSYERKVDGRWGEFSRLMRYIADQTSPDATILFPRGGQEGPIITRASLAAYFLYPRTVIADERASSVEADVTHVVMADGAPSFPVEGEQRINRARGITDDLVTPLRGPHEIDLVLHHIRVTDSRGQTIGAHEYEREGVKLARRTGGRAFRDERAHEIVRLPDGQGERFNFVYREGTKFDVWTLPLEVSVQPRELADIEISYSLSAPGVSIALEPRGSNDRAVVEALPVTDDAARETLHLSRVQQRLLLETGVDGSDDSSRTVDIQFKLVFTPGVEAVYPNLGIIEVARTATNDPRHPG